MLICENDRYCGERTEFESVEEFLIMCSECFGETPNLRLGHDRDGTEVYRDEHDEVALVENEQTMTETIKNHAILCADGCVKQGFFDSFQVVEDEGPYYGDVEAALHGTIYGDEHLTAVEPLPSAIKMFYGDDLKAWEKAWRDRLYELGVAELCKTEPTTIHVDEINCAKIKADAALNGYTTVELLAEGNFNDTPDGRVIVYCANGELVAKTNGYPVWEYTDSEVFADLLDECGIDLSSVDLAAAVNRRVLPMIVRNGKTVRSDEEGICADCDRAGWVSSWPGNDPANLGVTVLVLCASAHGGHLVCDECEEERDDE